MRAISVQEALLIHLFAEDAVLFHPPSGELCWITRPLGVFLQALDDRPRPVNELLDALPETDRAPAAAIIERFIADGLLVEG